MQLQKAEDIIMNLSLGLYFKDVELQKYHEGYYLIMEIGDMKGKYLVSEALVLQCQGYLSLENRLVFS